MAKKMLTEARAKTLTSILTSDANHAKELLQLSPEAVLEKINGGLGYDFTLDELLAYGEVAKRAASLSDDALAGVAGGAGTGDMEEDGPITAAVIVGGSYLIGSIISAGW